jgi:hypothetical protein
VYEFEAAMGAAILRWAKSLLFSEQQLEWASKYTPFGIIALPIVVLQFKFLPPQWVFGGITLICLFLFSATGIAFEDWDSKPGAWLRAALYLWSLCGIYWLMACWQWAPVIKSLWTENGAKVWGWTDVKLSIDTAMSFSVLQYQIRYALTVLIENVRRTGHTPMRIW